MSKNLHPVLIPAKYTKSTPLEKRAGLLKQIWQVSCWLSMDVVAGAVVSSAMVCKLMEVEPLPCLQLGVLGATVWLIYTLDHLWDVSRMDIPPITGRHFFHFRHKKALQIVAVAVFILLASLTILFLPLTIIAFGLALGALVAGYLGLVNFVEVYNLRNWFHKEVLIALLYTAGIWGSVGVVADRIVSEYIFLSFVFSLLALQNLLLFSYFELEEDIVQSQRSIVRVWGKTFTRKVLYLLSIIGLLVGIILFFSSNNLLVRNWVIIEWIMSGILLLLIVFPGYFQVQGCYRWIGDGVFILPASLILFEYF